MGLDGAARPDDSGGLAAEAGDSRRGLAGEAALKSAARASCLARRPQSARSVALALFTAW